MISVMEMKNKLFEAMEMLQTVCNGISTLEDRVQAGSEFDGNFSVEANKKKLSNAIMIAENAIQASSTCVDWTLTRKHQHQYHSPGDPKPTLKAVGPSKLLIQIHFDEGDVRRAVYGNKGKKHEREDNDSSGEQKITV